MSLLPWKNKGNAQPNTLLRMRQEMDDVLRRFWNDPWSAGAELAGGSLLGTPRMDMNETDDDLTLRFELPGVTAEDVDIRVTDNVLSLRGEKSEMKEEKRGDCTYSERSYGSFSRSVQLPPDVNPDSVDATYKDGVLTVRLAKTADAKPRKIEVRRG
jgi:HSP20 family protein